MNLAVLKKSNRAPKVGDIFAMLPSDGKYLYGRVICTGANPLGGRNSILIYIYRTRAVEKEPVPRLYREQLLVPPIMTNALPWRKGYFEFIENQSLTTFDCLPQHCFVHALTNPKRYFDEYGNEIMVPTEPVGEWGLHSFRTIDAEISNALGL